MATVRLSPTASILRHSRLFSLPPPLPRPSHDASTLNYQSDTATLHHPLQASIETTQASLARGDWGLKRSLPQQSTTATTTPVIRIGPIDSIDHITEFDSAADHTLTLRKWQEMNIPIALPSVRATVIQPPAVSVFEDDVDRTEVGTHGTTSNTKRWKYGGPWLAGKSNGEFEEYILKKVKGRRQEFRKFLRTKLHEKLVATSRRAAMDKGEVFQTPPDLSEEDFEAAIIQLRHNNDQLMDWIWQFLDLPRLSSQQQKHISESWISGVVGDQELEQGPPITHPSAGLSYLRTSSHVPNHPILGPVSSQPPVLARILSQGVSKSRTLFGVGGVVGEDAVERAYKDPKTTKSAIMDPNSEGGPKGWVHPWRAIIDPRGRVQLGVEKATDDSVALWEKAADRGNWAPSSMGRVEVGSSKLDYRKVPVYDSEGYSDKPPPVREYLPEKANQARASRELTHLLDDLRP